MIDPQIKFARARNGYDPEEVDAVFDEFSREAEDLKKQNRALSDTVRQYNAKIGQLEQGAAKLEQERIKESFRLTDVMVKATQIADELKAEAGKKADEAIAAAQLEAGTILAGARRELDDSANAARKRADEILGAAQLKAAEIVGAAQREAGRASAKAISDSAAAQNVLGSLIRNAASIRQLHEQLYADAREALSKLDMLLNPPPPVQPAADRPLTFAPPPPAYAPQHAAPEPAQQPVYAPPPYAPPAAGPDLRPYYQQ